MILVRLLIYVEILISDLLPHFNIIILENKAGWCVCVSLYIFLSVIEMVI